VKFQESQIKNQWRHDVDEELEKLIDDRLIEESKKLHNKGIEHTPSPLIRERDNEEIPLKTIPKMKKPLVPKMSINNAGTNEKKIRSEERTTKDGLSANKHHYDSQKTLKTATNRIPPEYNSVRQFGEEDEKKRRVQTDDHGFHTASTYRNLKGAEFLTTRVPLAASSSTTKLIVAKSQQLAGPGGHYAMSDKKATASMRSSQKLLHPQKNNENKVPVSVEENKKTIKAISNAHAIAKHAHLGINLQSCFSKDNGTCIEQLTALQAPKNSDRIGKLSIPKLTTSPRSPMKSKSHKILNPRTASKEDLFKHNEKDISVTERLRTIKKIFDKNQQIVANSTGKKFHMGGSGLGRSKTEEALLVTNMSERSLRTDSKLSKTQRQKIDSSLKALTSFGKTKNKENTSSQKSLAKEPSLRDFISLANMKLQNSTDISKSLRENHHQQHLNQTDEKQFYSSQKVSKNKSAKSLHKQIKTKGKASLKVGKSKPLSKEMYDYNSVATRRTTAGPHTSIPSSFSITRNPNLGSVPISPEKRTLNVNVSMKQLNSHGHKSVNDHTMDNSYGFWTSRSSKGNVDEPVNQLTRGMMKNSSSKFVLHTEGDHNDGNVKQGEKRYHTDHNITKPKVSKTRKATKVSMFQQFKETENEMLRNIKHLKPNYMLSAWPRGNQNKSLEEKEKNMSASHTHTTAGYISHIVPHQKTVKKSVKKGKKKVEGSGTK